MSEQNLLDRFSKIKVWTRGDQRAPHKPLLILYALAKLQQGQRWLPYSKIKAEVGDLLREFGPPRDTSPIYPFQYLRNDGLWTYFPNQPTSFTERFLQKNDVAGGFPQADYTLLRSNPALARTIATFLLNKNFPPSLHEDIVSATGLNLDPDDEGLSQETIKRSPRDPHFRQKVLQAYEYRCAVCGFDVRVGLVPVALEAAHIKWHQFQGPDHEQNGLALCSLHHKLFDSGAFALDTAAQGEQFVFKVSQQAHGTSGFDEWLLRFHNANLRAPQSPDYLPKQEFVNWHLREVFKGESRYSRRA